MLHRRLLSTDLKGPLDLNDADLVENMRSILILANKTRSAELRHSLQYELNFPPQIAFGNLETAPLSPWPFSAARSALNQPLPRNVHLLTLQQLNSTLPLLLRLAHIYETLDPSPWTLSAAVNLTALMPERATILGERALSAMLAVDEVAVNDRLPVRQAVISLNSTDIRTFFLQ